MPKSYLCNRGNVAKAILEKVFTLHPIKNAWHTIYFRSNSNRICQAALDDPMHFHCSGLIAYTLEVYFGHLKPAEAKEVEMIM